LAEQGLLSSATGRRIDLPVVALPGDASAPGASAPDAAAPAAPAQPAVVPS
jgi:hypothetical protein